MTRPITIRDVAQEASVSVATVSNAINRPSRVAAETRTRVLEVADRLGYSPYAAIRNRGGATTPRIGIIAPFSTYSSYAERLKGVLSSLSQEKIEALVFDHPSASRSPSPRLASLPFSGNLDGLIIMGIPMDTELPERLIDRGLPTVLVDTSHPLISSIILDEVHGAHLAARHLVDRGFQHFAYVSEGQVSLDYISQGRRRLTGFLRALTELGVPQENLQRITARQGDVEAGAAAADVIANRARRHRIGVLAGHDVLAAGVLSGLREQGIDVPGQVGVIGWDGGDLVEALGLTTVRQPLEESGRLGAERLVSILNNEQAPVAQVILRPVLKEGLTS